MKFMNKAILYSIIILVILLIIAIGWYAFNSIGKMMCGPCGCDNLGCTEPPAQTIVFECVTNQDCQPSEFDPDMIGTLFICDSQYKCINQTVEIESIVCSINEECPYGYECSEGSCWGME